MRIFIDASTLLFLIPKGALLLQQRSSQKENTTYALGYICGGSYSKGRLSQ